MKFKLLISCVGAWWKKYVSKCCQSCTIQHKPGILSSTNKNTRTEIFLKCKHQKNSQQGFNFTLWRLGNLFPHHLLNASQHSEPWWSQTMQSIHWKWIHFLRLLQENHIPAYVTAKDMITPALRESKNTVGEQWITQTRREHPPHTWKSVCNEE